MKEDIELIDFYAAKAMQGQISSNGWNFSMNPKHLEDNVEASFKIASKMLEERKKYITKPDQSVLIEEAYKKGWEEATSEAIQEIRKNYTPNEH